MTTRYLLRGLALAIAVLGLVDPAITSERPIRPVVAVIGGANDDAADAAIRRDVAARLASRYDIVSAASADAVATVVVGSALPADAQAIKAPAFSVMPAITGPTVAIASLDVPESATFGSSTPVAVIARVRQAAGRKLQLALTADGVTIDRVERPIASADERIAAELRLTTPVAGLAALHVTATIADTSAKATADAAVTLTDAPWPVLFFDRRPSWTSTFVRRALERDARFEVRSRTITSTGISTDRGQPPASLGDVATLATYAAVVIGAPDALTSAEVKSLDTFAGQRGGTIVLLVEQPLTGAAASLADVARWETLTPLEPSSIDPARGGAAMRAGEFVAPDRLPAGGAALASATIARANRVVAFERPLGAGRVVVNSATDAWRFRGVPESSPFDQFWQRTIGAAAESAPPAIDVSVRDRALAPYAKTNVRVTLRDEALGVVPAGVATTIAVTMADESGRTTPVRVWPDGAPGRFVGEIAAPATAGRYRIAATRGADRGAASFVVSPDVRRAADDENLVRAWVASRGGVSVASTELAALDRALASTLHPEHRAERWHPMRAGWWIVPFAALLGGEWWLRRRRDLR